MKNGIFIRLYVTLLLSLCLGSTITKAQETYQPSAFIAINGTLGRHNIIFRHFAKSPGLSFGYNVSVGIYAVNKEKYKGGLQITLLEGASRNENRRRLSEEFEIPYPDFDKHRVFKFAQFRSATIGWFSEYTFAENRTLYHQIGFGIFGTTELDQLLDFGMTNHVGILLGAPQGFNMRLGLSYDTTFGTGNPNYLQNNVGFVFGGHRSF